MELVNKIDETLSFNDRTIRVTGSATEPWFVAKDICSILGLPNMIEALKSIPEKWRGSVKLTTFGGLQSMVTINEAALYKLIMRSRKPVAQKFQEFVCEVILPTIRKTGEFKLQALLDEKEKQVRTLTEEKTLLERKNSEFSHKYQRRLRTSYKVGMHVYVGRKSSIRGQFKPGITTNLNQRLVDLENGEPEKFEYIKVWETRFAPYIESIIKLNFQRYVVGDSPTEYLDDSCYDQVMELIDRLVTTCNDFDTYTAPAVESPTLSEIKEPPAIYVNGNKRETKKCSSCGLRKKFSEFSYWEASKKLESLEEDIVFETDVEFESFINGYVRSQCKGCCTHRDRELAKKLQHNPNFRKKLCCTCDCMVLDTLYFYNQDGSRYDDCIACYMKNNNIEEEVKQCSECKLILSPTDFHRHSKNSLRKQCKKCRNDKIVAKRNAALKF